MEFKFEKTVHRSIHTYTLVMIFDELSNIKMGEFIEDFKKECEKNNSISDKLMYLAYLAKKVEEEDGIKV